ncbi:MAG TPA: NAD(P)/FAD-dependent oxidoreductase, partial [Candidatus Limnocylindria bacterium]|nr:NAD(P)/FAD-dependent oxidoreductase [Candidatus Limnocylindria bacterium]
LAMSKRLADRGLDHVVLERGEIGETWRRQRWDSFRLNTNNRMNVLPGDGVHADPDAFLHRDEWIAELERYASRHRLPVRTHARVVSVSASDGAGFVVATADGQTHRTRHVVVASGVANTTRTPRIAGSIDPRVRLFTTATYRRPSDLPPGAVLVVGSAQSGAQIAEDLVAAGRTVYLATGRVGRAPRRLRGADTLVWLCESGWMTQRPEDLADRSLIRAAQPLISGIGPRGKSLSLQDLARQGVTLLGHLDAADGTRLRFADDLDAHVRQGDALSQNIRTHIHEYLARAGIDAPASDPDPVDEPAASSRYESPRELDLADRGVTSIVFSIGFDTDRSWLRVPALGPDGEALHEGGRSPVPGLWWIGLLWMRHRRSGIIHGAAFDSEHIAERIAGGS